MKLDGAFVLATVAGENARDFGAGTSQQTRAEERDENMKGINPNLIIKSNEKTYRLSIS